MKAMVLHAPGPIASGPLHEEERELPVPSARELLVRVEVCGVCRTDLHLAEGDLTPLVPSVVPGHEVVGRVERVGPEVRTFAAGDRVGLPWLRHTCGRCEYCWDGRENLCAEKQFTGYSVDGGYAEYALGDEAYALRLPSGPAAALAPLLCAGIIGYRALKLARPRPGGRIGFFGFGGSAHLALQLAAKLGYEAVAYSRSPAHLDLATRLGATSTVLTGRTALPSGGPTLDAALVFAPVGPVVLDALAQVKRGGTVTIAAIHLTPIPTIDYDRLLFGERRLLSIEANTRTDAREFLTLAERLRLEPQVQLVPLRAANDALRRLKDGQVVGAVALDCRRP
jgi:propanol-preferring alcohol dehydrogenase